MPESALVFVKAAVGGICCVVAFGAAHGRGASPNPIAPVPEARCARESPSTCQSSSAQIRVLRGSSFPAGSCSSPSCNSGSARVEIVQPGGTGTWSVTVVRIGTTDGTSTGTVDRSQQVFGSTSSLTEEEFHDASGTTVTLVRGSVIPNVATARDSLTSSWELDKIAFAIEGVESNHGQNPAMWRRDLFGPQGPMQVSAPAALDVGGGDRFDTTNNRFMGRAYLAHLYHRYGNWPDAITAYNWGPSKVDTWISGGRPDRRLPLSVRQYLARVLGDPELSRGDDVIR